MNTRKAIWTVCVDNYMPEICALTFPTIERYAKRIGAEFHVISERKFRNTVPTYEKMQIFALGAEFDWNILIDADLAVSRHLPDVTTIVPMNHVGVQMAYDASLHFPCDKYFLRDGRKIGLASNFMAVSKVCHDIWTPLEIDPSSVTLRRPFMLDEYCIARNLARFGLKFAGIIADQTQIYHLNTTSEGKPPSDLQDYVRNQC